MTSSTKLLAGIELGGTKCVCVLGTGPADIRAQERLPTRDPEGTLAAIEAEMGHIRIARLPGDTWPGHCSFHGDCVEGLASGPAIEARIGASSETLPDDHPVWTTVVHAIAQLLHTMVVSTAPVRIIVGGGVLMSREGLFARIRTELVKSLNGYVMASELKGDLSAYVVPPALGGLSGALGALVLAERE
jgi:fructokinase